MIRVEQLEHSCYFVRPQLQLYEFKLSKKVSFQI